MRVVHFFVYFARLNFCLFSLSLGVSGWLRLVIVAPLDFSINFVLIICVPFPFGVWGRKCNSIVSVPDHCLFIYFS